jgi:hypothetical protein
MIVEVSPSLLVHQPGAPGELTVRLENGRDTISGFVVRVLGADPDWVEIDDPQPSLFPAESRQIRVRVRMPENFPAGTHALTLQVQEVAGLRECVLKTFRVSVPARERLLLTMKPPLVTGGGRAAFRLRAENTGNTTITSPLVGVDGESSLRFGFDAEALDLPPGAQTRVAVTVSRRRPWTGMPTPRMFAVHADSRTTEERRAGVPVEGLLAQGVFLQKPRISRVSLSLVASLAVLVAVLTIAAVTVGAALRKSSVEQANASQRLTAVSDPDAHAPSTQPDRCPCPVEGLVSASRKSAKVAFYPALDTVNPVKTVKVAKNGRWKAQLSAGDYKMRLAGPDLVSTWYPQAVDADRAEVIKVEGTAVRAQSLNDMMPGVALGSITVTLDVDNPVGAKVAVLMAPGTDLAGTLVTTAEPVDGTSVFVAKDVPLPGKYTIVASKTGYTADRGPLSLGAPGQAKALLRLKADPNSGLRGPAGAEGPRGLAGLNGEDGQDGNDGNDGRVVTSTTTVAGSPDPTTPSSEPTTTPTSVPPTSIPPTSVPPTSVSPTEQITPSTTVVTTVVTTTVTQPAQDPGGESSCQWWRDIYLCVRPGEPTTPPTTEPPTATETTSGGTN